MIVFLSTPISHYKSQEELQLYKDSIVNLIMRLRKKHVVCAEIENVFSDSDYDTPEKSISKDLDLIRKCDLFIMHYPQEIPTSALIELGFALASEKRIIVLTPNISKLPYLAQGIPMHCPGSLILECKEIDSKVINVIDSFIDN